jgi:hypothetical protein
MKFIDAIQTGDFVRLKSLEQLKEEYDYSTYYSDTLVFYEKRSDAVLFTIGKEHIHFLGKVQRIKSVDKSSCSTYFKIEETSCFGSLLEKYLIDSILVNGKWYKVEDSMDELLEN